MPACIERLLHAVGGGAHHLGVDAEILAVIDPEIVGGGIGVEHRGNVVLGVARREQHAGHGEHAGDALGFQLVQTGADDRGGEFEIAIFDRIVRQALLQMFRQHGELAHRRRIAAAVATNHHTEFFRHVRYLPYASAAGKSGPEGSSGLGPRLGRPHRNCFQSLMGTLRSEGSRRESARRQ